MVNRKVVPPFGGNITLSLTLTIKGLLLQRTNDLFSLLYTELVSSHLDLLCPASPSPPTPCCFHCHASFQSYESPFHAPVKRNLFIRFKSLGSKPGYHGPKIFVKFVIEIFFEKGLWKEDILHSIPGGQFWINLFCFCLLIRV